MMLQDMKVMLSDLWHWLAQDAEYVLRNSEITTCGGYLGDEPSRRVSIMEDSPMVHSPVWTL